MTKYLQNSLFQIQKIELFLDAGSGSKGLRIMRIHVDPDLQHWREVKNLEIKII